MTSPSNSSGRSPTRSRAIAADRPRHLLSAGLVKAGLVTGSLLLGATAIALWVGMVF
jgi:hypothetical protein